MEFWLLFVRLCNLTSGECSWSQPIEYSAPYLSEQTCKRVGESWRINHRYWYGDGEFKCERQ